uniref:Uncharacterized protein n=1 Tax=Cucumis melo TaxID=3656 RepID=A0A9I9EEJ9_CUCME
MCDKEFIRVIRNISLRFIRVLKRTKEALTAGRRPPTPRALNHGVLKRLVRIDTIYSSVLVYLSIVRCHSEFKPLSSSLSSNLGVLRHLRLSGDSVVERGRNRRSENLSLGEDVDGGL